MKSLNKRKQKRANTDTITPLTIENMMRVVEEANRENGLQREFSDMLLGCCSGLESVQDEFDVDRELEELEKEIALAKEVKPSGKVKVSMTHSSPKQETRETRNQESQDTSFVLGSRRHQQQEEKDVRASPSSTSDSRSRSSSQSSWTDDLIDSTNVDFLIGSCSSRQVDVDLDVSTGTSTAVEI
mmetsp:Transcript_16095/g.34991  ORF Transcript_16095/g.34991 Transcript_16095/m.34991 type:complete len:185 (+) Transcript_16095:132-686(+)